jgi:hypothetical protein
MHCAERWLGTDDGWGRAEYRSGRSRAFLILKTIRDLNVDPSAEAEAMENLRRLGTQVYLLGVESAIRAWYELRGKVAI